jgi:hypothetical protein
MFQEVDILLQTSRKVCSGLIVKTERVESRAGIKIDSALVGLAPCETESTIGGHGPERKADQRVDEWVVGTGIQEGIGNEGSFFEEMHTLKADEKNLSDFKRMAILKECNSELGAAEIVSTHKTRKVRVEFIGRRGRVGDLRHKVLQVHVRVKLAVFAAKQCKLSGGTIGLELAPKQVVVAWRWPGVAYGAAGVLGEGISERDERQGTVLVRAQVMACLGKHIRSFKDDTV